MILVKETKWDNYVIIMTGENKLVKRIIFLTFVGHIFIQDWTLIADSVLKLRTQNNVLKDMYRHTRAGGG